MSLKVCTSVNFILDSHLTILWERNYPFCLFSASNVLIVEPLLQVRHSIPLVSCAESVSKCFLSDHCLLFCQRIQG